MDKQSPGLLPVLEPPVSAVGQGASGVSFKAWISTELVQETKKVWTEAYGREVSDDEALEILSNVKRLAEVLVHIQKVRVT